VKTLTASKRLKAKSWNEILYYTAGHNPGVSNDWGAGFVAAGIQADTANCGLVAASVGGGATNAVFPTGFAYVTPLVNCWLQKIGASTTNTKNLGNLAIKVKVGSTTYQVVVQTKNIVAPFYNCHGWAIGLEEVLGSVVNASTQTLLSIKTIGDYKRFLRQLKAAYTAVENGLNLTYLRLAGKIQGGSLLEDLIQNYSNTYFDKKLISYQNINSCATLDGRILLYGDDTKFTHSAVYIGGTINSWTSKVGLSALYTHSIDGLNGLTYGRPRFVLCRTNANGTLTTIPDNTKMYGD